MAKSRMLLNISVLPTLGRTFRPVQQKNTAAEGKITDLDTDVL